MQSPLDRPRKKTRAWRRSARAVCALSAVWLAACNALEFECDAGDPACNASALLFYACRSTLMGGAAGCPLTLSGTTSTLAGSGAAAYADGAGVSAQFSSPYAVTSDGSYVFVADSLNHRIRKIEIATGLVTTLAGDGTGAYLDGVGAAAQFNNPNGITCDGPNLYVADTGNHRIRKIVIATGLVSTLAGDGTNGYLDGTGTGARFNTPYGLSADGVFVYLADTLNQRIRRIHSATAQVTTLAGDGVGGYLDAIGTSARFNTPAGVVRAGTKLYISDLGNNRIRSVDLTSGAVATFVGDGTAGYLDGTGTAARISGSYTLTTDGAALYFPDTSNHRVRRVNLASAIVSTLAGDGVGAFANGAGPDARFFNPTGITSDGRALYIADTGNQRIRKIE